MKTLYSRSTLVILPVILSMQTYAAKATLPETWHAHPPHQIKPNTNPLTPSGFSPAQIIQAYGFPSAYQGQGQTVAIVDAMDDPNIEADLAVFSNTFGLPACTTANGCFKKIYASGSKPAGDTDWGTEMSLDVEWVHAIAPQAKIILVEAADTGEGLYDAITVALQNHATVVSCSWGGEEFNGETSFDSIFQNSKVPITVSSGDSGYGVSYPAASPYVLSVGGTALSVNSSGGYASETAWSGSSGGISAYESQPSYQANLPIPQNPNKMRGVPDVSYNGDPNTGFSVYDSYGEGGWMVVGGTSAGAPQWAALIAVANSASGHNISTANTLLYTAAASSYSTLFHDVTSGTNGSCGYYCTARIGYDYVTGLGSPKTDAIISALGNGTQIVQFSNALYNNEASKPGMTQTSALVKFYTGSSVLCDSRTLAYGAAVTLQPGVGGSGTGHTTCTANQKITSITATPATTNTTIGAIYGTAPINYTVASTSGITQVTLQQQPADTNDYAPVFDVTNDVIKTIGVAQIAGD